MSWVLVAVGFGEVARADELLTLAGRTAEGRARFEERDAITFSPTTGSAIRLALADILKLTTDTPATLERGVLMVDGTILAIEELRDSDDRAIRIRRKQNGETTIASSQVAAIVFRSVDLASLDLSRSGAVLTDGDFFEGEFLGYANRRVRISSVIFGIREFEAGKEAAALICRPARAIEGELIVRLADGSVLAAGQPRIEGRKLQLDHPLSGRLSLDLREIAAIESGGGRVTPVASLSQIGTVPTRFGLPGATVTHDAIAVLSGSRVSFRLPTGARALIGTVGLDPATLPGARVRFVVSVDGREIYRSDPVDASSAGLPLSAALRAGTAIELSVIADGDAKSALPVRGQWRGATIIRGAD